MHGAGFRSRTARPAIVGDTSREELPDLRAGRNRLVPLPVPPAPRDPGLGESTPAPGGLRRPPRAAGLPQGLGGTAVRRPVEHRHPPRRRAGDGGTDLPRAALPAAQILQIPAVVGRRRAARRGVRPGARTGGLALLPLVALGAAGLWLIATTQRFWPAVVLHVLYNAYFTSVLLAASTWASD